MIFLCALIVRPLFLLGNMYQILRADNVVRGRSAVYQECCKIGILGWIPTEVGAATILSDREPIRTNGFDVIDRIAAIRSRVKKRKYIRC